MFFQPFIKSKSHYPRVTHILSKTKCKTKAKALYNWKMRLGQQADVIRDEALARGTKFHKEVESYIRKETVSISPSIPNIISSLNIKIIACELRVYNNELGYRGTCDLVYKNKETGLYGILDWKTSKKERPLSYFPDYKCQLAAYAMGIEDGNDIEVSEAMIVVAYPKENSNPFSLEKLWGFQIVQMNKSQLKRSANRFKKKLVQFNTGQIVEYIPEPVEQLPMCANPFL